jgi:RNA polymerase sigma factor (TIGR02999 family)
MIRDCFDRALQVRRVTMATSGAKEPEEVRPAADLLPAIDDELRHLAAVLTQRRRPGQTLQATALVHEAYLRLVGDQDPAWQGRRHFFGAAARAMRQILIEQARRKASHKHGGPNRRVDLAEGMAFRAAGRLPNGASATTPG